MLKAAEDVSTSSVVTKVPSDSDWEQIHSVEEENGVILKVDSLFVFI